MSHEAIFLVTQWRCIASCKEDFPVSHRIFTTSLAAKKNCVPSCRKIEAASTFRNATRQVAACDTPTATCLAIFL